MRQISFLLFPLPELLISKSLLHSALSTHQPLQETVLEPSDHFSPLFYFLLITTVCSWSITPVCPTLWDPMDCSPPGSSVHGILQARILEWVAMPSSEDLPDPGTEPVSLMSPVLPGGFFTTSTIWEAVLLALLGTKYLWLICCLWDTAWGRGACLVPQHIECSVSRC